MQIEFLDLQKVKIYTDGLRQFLKLNKSDVIRSVCNHNFNDGINLRDTCKNCGVKRNTVL